MSGAADSVDPDDTVLAKIEEFFDSNGLSGFGKAMAKQWVVTALSDRFPAGSCARVLHWLRQQVVGKRSCSNTWQRGCPELIPGLRSQPLWWLNPLSFPDHANDPRLSWVAELEANFETIRAEVLALRSVTNEAGALDGFQQYRTPKWDADAAGGMTGKGASELGHDRGDWNVYYLNLHNADYSMNRARCPATCAVLDRIPRTARIRVGDATIPFQEGRCFVFDDSFEHEVWNETEASRIVLILDVWHPDLSDTEIKFLKFLNAGQLRLARKIGVEVMGDSAEDFYAVLERARLEGSSIGSVFAGADDL